MGEYIRKNDVIEVLIKTIVPPSITLDTLIQRIDNIPRADVVEVRHGHWIYGESEEGHDGYRCSECGEFVPWEYGEYDIDFIKEVHYCLYCGAQMDEK